MGQGEFHPVLHPAAQCHKGGLRPLDLRKSILGFIGDEKPPFFTKGMQYSDKVERFATALDTHRSKHSRNLPGFAESSALP